MLQYILYKAIIYFSYFIVVYVAAMSLLSLTQMLVSMIYTPAYMRKVRFSDIKMFSASSNIVPISVLVPAYNEEQTIVQSIKSLLSLNYTAYEVVVINDGSKDSTLKTVIEAFNLARISYPVRSQIASKEISGIYYNPDYPKLLLIDKENGGKADALNAGINISKYPYFASIDADSLLDSDSLIRIAMSSMEFKYTIAVGGIVRIANGCKVENGKVIDIRLSKNSIARFQIVEYFRAFLVGRSGWGASNFLLLISGAFGAFQKSVVIDAGGYTTGTIGEDMDLVMKLHKYMRDKKYRYKIAFLPDPVCWTQAPENIHSLYGQRRRWHIGLMDCLKRYKKMFLNPRYGMVGLLSMPYYFFFEMVGPVVEALGLIFVPLSYFFGLLSVNYFILFFALTTIFGVVISVGSLAIEEYTFNKYARLSDVFILSVYAFIENFSYRQLTVFFRLMGVIHYKKHKNTWGQIQRKKFNETKTDESKTGVVKENKVPIS